MTQNEIKQILDRQRAFFHTGATLDVSYRLDSLRRLRDCITRHEADINKALKKDLGKSAFETYMCETGLVLSEISYMLKHTRSFAKEKRVHTPLAQFHSRSYRKPSPYGVCLIMSPWNYPFLLTIDPLIDAIAAGNTAVIKPSAYKLSSRAPRFFYPDTGMFSYYLIVQKTTTAKCFAKKYLLFFCRIDPETICYVQYFFSPWVSIY